MKKDDLTNCVFGRLTAVHTVPTHTNTKWYCICICGNSTTVYASNLKRGITKSCGCLAKENLSQRAKISSKKHGDSTTRLYNIWKGMLRRCSTPSSSAYKNYGALGITVCPEWHTYIVFKLWAINQGYTDTLTLDRLDATKNYVPENCRWATYQIQTRNRRKTASNTSSKFLGVSFHVKTNSWMSYITLDRKLKYLGKFKDEVSAAKARDDYIKTYKLEGFKYSFIQEDLC